MRKLIVAAFAVFVVAGCATLGVPQPRSFADRVAAAYTGVSITNDTATILTNAGTISKEDGRKVLKQSRAAREAVDVAGSLQGQIGEDALTNALTLLRLAQDLMCADRPAEPNCAYLIQKARP